MAPVRLWACADWLGILTQSLHLQFPAIANLPLPKSEGTDCRAIRPLGPNSLMATSVFSSLIPREAA